MLEMVGEEDAPSVVIVKELIAVLQAMDEKYKVLFDAFQKQGESSKSHNEMKDEVHPLLMPSVKLEGADSYASWQSMLRQYWSQGSLKIIYWAQLRNRLKKIPRRVRGGI